MKILAYRCPEYSAFYCLKESLECYIHRSLVVYTGAEGWLHTRAEGYEDTKAIQKHSMSSDKILSNMADAMVLFIFREPQL